MPALKHRFLALGDSYTIGEGVEAGARWPAQLVALLRERGVPLDHPEIVARTGWTTDELDAAIDAAAPRGEFHLVSLLIGVNDQYRGRGVERFRDGLEPLLARAAGFAGGRPDRVLLLSIPDWGATPFAADRDRQRVAAEIDAFNAAARAAGEACGARWVDVTDLSRGSPELLVEDGLHPSGAMYALWARRALPAAQAALGLVDGEVA